jgi:hypothetical protein
MKMAKIKILDLEVKKIVQLTSDEQYLIQGGCRRRRRWWLW